MTTQKAQRKIKSSTVAITVLSILLAIAVVSTIVLAAFSATKSASTTITFGNGITLTISGTTTGTEESPDTSTNKATLYWTANVGGTADYDGTVDAGDASANVTLEQIQITATGPTNSVYVAVKPTVSYTGNGTGNVTLDLGENWVQVGSTGWYVYTTADSANDGTAATVFPTSQTPFTTGTTAIFTTGTDNANDFGGRTYTCSIEVQAVSDKTTFVLD